MYSCESISFRKLERSDLYSLWKLKQESWVNTHQITINSNDDQEKWFDSLDDNPHNPKNLILVASGFIEDFGIFKISNINYISRSADVGWDVYENCRGIGLGKKIVKAGSAFCFEVLNLRRLNAEILTTNIASQKCAKHAGYIQEGIKRDAVHKIDKYIDSLIYGLLSKEFEK